MPAPVWYAASLLVITAVVFYKLGRVAGLLDGYDQGWDAGRAARVEQLLDAADSLRALTLVPAPPYDQDGER